MQSLGMHICIIVIIIIIVIEKLEFSRSVNRTLRSRAGWDFSVTQQQQKRILGVRIGQMQTFCASSKLEHFVIQRVYTDSER